MAARKAINNIESRRYVGRFALSQALRGGEVCNYYQLGTRTLGAMSAVLSAARLEISTRTNIRFEVWQTSGKAVGAETPGQRIEQIIRASTQDCYRRAQTSCTRITARGSVPESRCLGGWRYLFQQYCHRDQSNDSPYCYQLRSCLRYRDRPLG